MLQNSTLRIASLFALALPFLACAPEESDAGDTSTESAVTGDDEIVGGVVSAAGSWKGTAALYSQGEQVCGGTLVAPEWIVTAAHCVEPKLPRGGIDNVVLGKTKLSATGGETITVLSATRHPSYSSATSSNDIALLRLSRAATTPVVKIASPTAFAKLSATATSTVVGWGVTRMGAYWTSNSLRQVSIPLIPIATCQTYPGYSGVNNTQLCAGLPQGGKDSCQGDSGGPLYATIGTTTMQVGVVSWGLGCAKPNAPGVYTRISSFETWLSTASNGAIVASQ